MFLKPAGRFWPREVVLSHTKFWSLAVAPKILETLLKHDLICPNSIKSLDRLASCNSINKMPVKAETKQFVQ